jgi:hypothetical protein
MPEPAGHPEDFTCRRDGARQRNRNRVQDRRINGERSGECDARLTRQLAAGARRAFVVVPAALVMPDVDVVSCRFAPVLQHVAPGMRRARSRNAAKRDVGKPGERERQHDHPATPNLSKSAHPFSLSPWLLLRVARTISGLAASKIARAAPRTSRRSRENRTGSLFPRRSACSLSPCRRLPSRRPGR